MTKRRILLSLISVVVLFGSLFVFQKLLMPKYMTGIVEGSLIEAYYEEELKHDVVFIGDCEVYENFSPITLWEEYGVTSFIRGSAQQLIWQSYYLLEETIKYEKPEVVVFNILSMKYDTPQKEAYNRMSLDGMKMSKSKIDSINASMLEEENIVDYIFPFLRYHARWSELSSDDFKYMFSKDKLFHNGYYMRVDVKAVDYIPKAKKLANYEFGKNSYDYLDKMVELCKMNDIELILIKAPTLYPVWYDEWEVQMEEYAIEHDLLYLNFLELLDEVGIDFNTDTYDAGLHLNLAGAEKLSTYFGEVLVTNYNLQDRRDNDVYNSVWKEKIEFYYSMKNEQLKDLEEFGHIRSYGQVASDDDK